MKCKDCRYSEVPRDVLDTSTEVIFCPRFGQYRAAECERSCDGFAALFMDRMPAVFRTARREQVPG